MLWSLCRHGLGKGLIVCPSSLVSNWDAEIHKWLPQSLARSVLVLHANSNSTTNFDKYIRKQIRATVSAVRGHITVLTTVPLYYDIAYSYICCMVRV